MRRLLSELEYLIEKNMYYSGLFLSLSLIDICSKIEYPNMKPEQKSWGKYNAYMKWVDIFYSPLFEKNIDCPIITSEDIYTMRCKISHEGTVFLDNKNCTRIILTHGSSHRNVACVSNGESTIIEKQLNVKNFIQEILKSINAWCESKPDEEVLLDFNIEDKIFSTNLGGFQVFYNCD